jgi:hypothetical protein
VEEVLAALLQRLRTQGPIIWRALLAFTADAAVADDALAEASASAGWA